MTENASQADEAAARAAAKRARVVGYLRKSRALQDRMKFIIGGGVALSIALVVTMGAAYGIGFLVLTGIVGFTGYWITAGHIRDFRVTLREIDEHEDRRSGTETAPVERR